MLATRTCRRLKSLNMGSGQKQASERRARYLRRTGKETDLLHISHAYVYYNVFMHVRQANLRVNFHSCTGAAAFWSSHFATCNDDLFCHNHLLDFCRIATRGRQHFCHEGRAGWTELTFACERRDTSESGAQ